MTSLSAESKSSKKVNVRTSFGRKGEGRGREREERDRGKFEKDNGLLTDPSYQIKA